MVIKVRSLTNKNRTRAINTPGSRAGNPPKCQWEKLFPVQAAAFQHLGRWRSTEAAEFMVDDEFLLEARNWHDERQIPKANFVNRIKCRCDHRGARYESENKDWPADISAEALRETGQLIKRMTAAGIKPLEGEIKSPGSSSSHSTDLNFHTVNELLPVEEKRIIRRNRSTMRTKLMTQDLLDPPKST